MDDVDPDAGRVSFVFDNKFIEVIEEDYDTETHETMEDPRNNLATNESDVEKEGNNEQDMEKRNRDMAIGHSYLSKYLEHPFQTAMLFGNWVRRTDGY
jgi:hypothetical protein